MCMCHISSYVLLRQPVTCSGAKIEEILLHWKGDYEKLERHHGYIQW